MENGTDTPMDAPKWIYPWQTDVTRAVSFSFRPLPTAAGSRCPARPKEGTNVARKDNGAGDWKTTQ